jgi:hypothetical protein
MALPGAHRHGHPSDVGFLGRGTNRGQRRRRTLGRLGRRRWRKSRTEAVELHTVERFEFGLRWRFERAQAVGIDFPIQRVEQFERGQLVGTQAVAARTQRKRGTFGQCGTAPGETSASHQPRRPGHHSTKPDHRTTKTSPADQWHRRRGRVRARV